MAIAVSLGRPGSHPGFRDRLNVDLHHDRPHMALGGFTPKQRLAMAALLLLLNRLQNGGFPSFINEGADQSPPGAGSPEMPPFGMLMRSSWGLSYPEVSFRRCRKNR